MFLKHLVLKIPERLKTISELPAAFKIKYKFLFFNNTPILPILPNTFIFLRQAKCTTPVYLYLFHLEA